MLDARQRLVDRAVQLSELKDYAGSFEELGGGEVNETFLLHGIDENYILRITKIPTRDTLLKEAHALELLDMPEVPKKVFFDANKLIDNRFWILESQVRGTTVTRLSPAQFESFGKLLAQVHTVGDPHRSKLDLWAQFLRSCRYFGAEEFLLAHPYPKLRSFIVSLHRLIQTLQPEFGRIAPKLIHGDATPSNILAQDNQVGLIDWEFSSFSDPMREFSTIYYDDMEYNRGKWRIRILPAEKQALFSGYRASGGELFEDRIDFWTNFDKVTAAIFLYWKLNQSEFPAPDQEREQNQLDFNNLLDSLENNLS